MVMPRTKPTLVGPVPEPVTALKREPLIAAEGKGWGGGRKKSYAKFTGTKLTDGRGNQKRARGKAKKRAA